MTNWEDYYQILGVDPAASAEEIRAAWRRKALELHPDRLSQVSEIVRHSAQEELKKVNGAYEVLGNDQKRRSHDADWLRSNSPPKPVLEPFVIIFRDAEPGVGQSGSFVIRNDGGAYKSIWFSDPGSWVRVTGYASLQPDDELPLQVEITASGHDWGKYYTESIEARLDGVEAVVRVQLQTKTAPGPHRARPAPTPPPPLRQPAWGKWAIGAVALGIIIVAAVATMAEQSDRPAINSRPPVTQSWSQGTTGSNYLGAPTPQPWPPGFQTGYPGIQPWPSGFQPGYPGIQPQPSGFQQTSPGFPQTSPGFRQTSPGVRASSPFRGVMQGVQPRSLGIRSGFVGQPNRSAGSQRGSGMTQPSSSGFGGYSGGFNFPGR